MSCASSQLAEREGTSTDVLKTSIAPHETIDLTRETTTHVNEYAATRAQVSAVLLTIADDLAMPLRSADAAAGVVVYYIQAIAPRIADRPASAWVDCGRGPGGGARADTYQLTLRLTAVVDSLEPHSTRVRVALVAFARDRAISADGLPCTSSGALEQRTLTAVAARIPR
jgi:hypothetical protein